MVLQRLLGRVDHRIEMVTRFDRLAFAFVLFSMRLSIFNHLFDLGLIQPTRGGDPNRLLFPSAKVFRIDVDDAVRINIESYLNLRHATRSSRNANKIKLPKQLVRRCHISFALENANGHRGLIVRRSREHLALLGWDSRVAINKTSKHSAEGFDAE